MDRANGFNGHDRGAPLNGHAVQWAYLVGGSPDVYRDVRAKLLKQGVNVNGWVRIDGKANAVRVPRGTTIVLVASDGCLHTASEAATEEAKKLGVPVISAPFRSWGVLWQRLAARGITSEAPGSIFETRQRLTLGDALGARAAELYEKIAAPEPPPPPAKQPPAPPKPPKAVAVDSALYQRALEAGKPPRVAAAPQPPQEYENKGRPFGLTRARSPEAERRHDLAVEYLKQHGEKTMVKEVQAYVQAQTGKRITSENVQRIRVEMGFRPTVRGGVLMDSSHKVSAHLQRLRDRLAPPPPPTPEPVIEAPEPPPPPPLVVAPPPPPEAVPEAPADELALLRLEHAKKDTLVLIAEIQARLPSLGVSSVTIERDGYLLQTGRKP